MAYGVAFHRERLPPDDNLRAIPRRGGSDNFPKGNQSDNILWKGTPLDEILDLCREPPRVNEMAEARGSANIIMIANYNYDPLNHRHRNPKAINDGKSYDDKWDDDHVLMPCSPRFVDTTRKWMWERISGLLRTLKMKCDQKGATFEDLKNTIEKCAGHQYDLTSLEMLIRRLYSDSELSHFMSTVLSHICQLAMGVAETCSKTPPLLRRGKSQSLTMSQYQAASLLACAFFCLFPQRSENDQSKAFENFQNPNFNRLYQSGSPEKIEKLKCILHYFDRTQKRMPGGVISFRRYVLTNADTPRWSTSTADLCDIHITAEKKIENIECTLQVDFANKYIGGGVLGNGCVQEEIRFSLCPEMLVSLLVCEKMEPNECIFLVGCERFSQYEGYAGSFKFAGDYEDKKRKDNWGRKWCHLIAIDALFFRDRTVQYTMNSVSRELIKAYTGFRPRPAYTGSENLFGIATGHWGCGAFNGDKQLKAIIQLMAASEAQRPLIYCAFHDNNFVNSFAEVYDVLKRKKATVHDLYQYLEKYSTRYTSGSLFEFILANPIVRDKPK